MSLRTLTATVLLSLGSVAAASAAEVTTVSCPFNGGSGDNLTRGFYVSNYTGHTLGRVLLRYNAGAAGLYRIGLTARRGTYDGPQLGETQWVTVELSGSGNSVYFDFDGVPVTPGNRITFQQTYTGPGSLHYDVGDGPCANVTQTSGTTPPLSSFRRDSVGVVITSFEPSLTGCVPSDTVLCIDDDPGDRRFRVTVTYDTVQGGGLSGSGDAIPLAPRGVTRGGLFWFFTADNPELLVKVLNGCGVNNRYWVFLTAGTNVGYTVSVRDMVTSATRTFTNADLHAAEPVQHTSAFSCS